MAGLREGRLLIMRCSDRCSPITSSTSDSTTSSASGASRLILGPTSSFKVRPPPLPLLLSSLTSSFTHSPRRPIGHVREV